jgi:2-oxoglutarate ferredoxin oxidoreductase subunit alpha
VVVVDSDEHDEEGHITENLNIRTKMVDKRLKKIKQIKNDAISPELVVPEDYQEQVLGLCSTYWPIARSSRKHPRKLIKKRKYVFLHMKQLYPIHKSVVDYLERARCYNI